MNDNKEFWNDEKVIDFHKYYMGGETPTIYEAMEKFKSKEVSNKPKDFEIQCIVKDGKNYWVQEDVLYKSDLFGSHLPSSWFLANDGTIHSVKRISDSEVFSIGDNIVHRESPDCSWSLMDAKIIKFSICQNEMLVEFMPTNETNPAGSIVRSINDIKKEERVPLFTTEDGKEIFEGDDWWIVGISTDEWHLGKMEHRKGHIPNLDYKGKRFSTEDKAKEYISKNKPKEYWYVETSNRGGYVVQKGGDVDVNNPKFESKEDADNWVLMNDCVLNLNEVFYMDYSKEELIELVKRKINLKNK